MKRIILIIISIIISLFVRNNDFLHKEAGGIALSVMIALGVYMFLAAYFPYFRDLD